jgi:hypothetical protein
METLQKSSFAKARDLRSGSSNETLESVQLMFERDRGGIDNRDRCPRQLSLRRKAMREMKVEKPEVVPASETDSEVKTSSDQNRTESEDPPSKLATGRLPARASRI